MTNPLLDFSGLPRFAEIRTEHITPAVEQLLADSRAVVDKVRSDAATPTWQNFVQPMEDANEHLSRAWGQASHLNAVMNNPQLREAYNANLPKITQHYAELAQDQGLFEKFKQLRNSAKFENFSRARKTIVDNELRDFRLGGAELPPEKKQRFLRIQEELSALESRFSDNLLDATNAFTLQVENANELTGIPDDVLQTAKELAEKSASTGWTFTLHAPCYQPVMQYADNRVLREKMYRAYGTRASEFGKPEWDNTALMDEIVKLRGEEARLLGFGSFSELSLASKMANSPQQVVEFLHELAKRARLFAERDLAELREFACAELGLADLQSWDIAYASEKLRERRYAFSEQEVKQYFPEDAVLPGMFRLVEALYGLRIKASSAPIWHDDVRFFDIFDAREQLVGQFYLDLYARNGKRGGAWMDDAITRRRLASGIQTPVAYLNCNFAAPVGKLPALFTHDEVITLFHEFGHGLHHLLTQVEDLGVSGINGVEWDAVELPSQFMENFCWEWGVVRSMTRRVDSSDSPDSGEALPQALFDKMLAAKNFQSGLQTLRQIEFSLFDMRMHNSFEVGGGKSILQLLDEVRAEVAVLRPPAFHRFPHSFSHIFAGGYAAGYYSYKWAEVLSADAYSLFEENHVSGDAATHAKTGERFRKEILAVGGSRPALESFIAFRGREPNIDALLRHNGMLSRDTCVNP